MLGVSFDLECVRLSMSQGSCEVEAEDKERGAVIMHTPSLYAWAPVHMSSDSGTLWLSQSASPGAIIHTGELSFLDIRGSMYLPVHGSQGPGAFLVPSCTPNEDRPVL